MSRNFLARQGDDGYYYPYTSLDLVKDDEGKSASTKFEEINAQINNVEENKADKDEVAAQFQTVGQEINILKPKIDSLGNGSPKGTFATLTALQSDTSANTTDGKKSIYVVTSDGGWYYWNGTTWTKGGTYQSTSVADNSIALSKIDSEFYNAVNNTNIYFDVLNNSIVEKSALNGATINGNTINIPIGSTGQNSYIKYKSILVKNSFNRLQFTIIVSKDVGFGVGININTVDSNGITSYGKAINIRTIVRDNRYYYQFDCDINSDVKEVQPNLTISNSNNVTSNTNVSILGVTFKTVSYLGETNYLMSNYLNEYDTYKKYVDDTYNLLDNSLLELNLADIATYSNRTVNIPSGITGNGIFFKLYHRLSNTDLGKIKFDFEIKSNVLNATQLSVNVNAKKKDGTIVYSLASGNTTKQVGEMCYYTCYIDVTGDIEEIHPYLIINNTTSLTSSANIEIVNAKFSVVGDYKTNISISEYEKIGIENTNINIINKATTSKTFNLDVSKNDYIYIDVDVLGDTSLVVSTKIQNKHIPLNLKNVNTGFVTAKITTRGLYQVYVKDFELIRFFTTTSSGSASLANVYAKTVNNNNLPHQEVYRKNTRFNMAESYTVAGKYISGLRDEICYLYSGNIIKYSLDYGKDNFPHIKSTISEITSIKKLVLLENGNTLVISSDGKVLLSENDMSTWSNVLTLDPLLLPNIAFGTNVYKNIVVINEYKPQKTPPSGYKVYVSFDYGKTFKVLFDLSAQPDMPTGEFHLHDACYDPHENMFWVCTGDGRNSMMIFYSKDNGITWWKATKQGYAPTQSSSIICLKNCVLFVSDARLTSVIRYNRSDSGTIEGSELFFDTALVIKEKWGESNATEVPIASKVCIDYNRDIAFFGYQIAGNCMNGITTNELKSNEVFVTDGYNFKVVCTNGSITESGGGIVGLYDEFSKGNKKIVAFIGGFGGAVIDTTNVI